MKAVRWTAEQLSAWQAQRVDARHQMDMGEDTGHTLPAASRMNKTEARYVTEILEPLRQHGVIRIFEYEVVKLRIGDNCWYTPDFLVIDRYGRVEFHEIKAYWAKAKKVGWKDDARVKWKAAGAAYPWAIFIAAWPMPKSGWGREECNP